MKSQPGTALARPRRPQSQPDGSVTISHFALPGIEIAREQAQHDETIAAFLERTQWKFKLPTICVINGAPVLRADWQSVALRPDDKVSFVSRPGKGGSSSKIFGLVALIAVAALSIWAGPLIAGALFPSLTGTALTIVGGLFTAGIALGGSFLVNALLFPNAGQGALGDASTDQVQQLYSIAASGNVASPLSAIPVQYGKWKDFPPYAATPWSEYVGNDQYLNLLLCLGCGEYDVENLYIDDTVLWDLSTGFNPAFTDVQAAVYGPGEDITLFPINVTSSPDVASLTLVDPTGDPNSGWIGGFVANASGTLANALSIDLVFPSGMFTIDSSGNLGAASVTIEVQIQTVDDGGAPTDAYADVFNETFTFSTRQPQRATLKTDPLTPARYQVRVRRGDAPLAGTTGANDAVWEGLRAFIEGPTSFAGVTTQAIRIKATSQVSQSSAKSFGVKRTRKLPVWDGSEWNIQTTRNPVWAFYDAATNTDYGAARPVSKVDFQALVDLAAICDSRSDFFDYVFTTPVVVPEAFDTILKTCRSRHRWAGDLISVVRDQFSTVPQMLLTDRETVRGSLSIDWTFNSDDQSDSVIISYVDENTWAAAQVQYPPNSDSFTAVNPTTITLPGITNRAQAFREAGFWYLQAVYRRTNVTLDTEHDGRLLSFGSPVRVQSELPQTWGATGTIVSVSGDTLTLDPAPSWADSGAHYIAIRTKTGAQFGPVLCTQGGVDSLAALDAGDLSSVQSSQGITLADALARATGAEDPSFDFGIATSNAKNCVVVSGRPNGDKVTLTMFVDDERVHTDDLGDVPVGPSSNPLTDGPAPVIQGLAAYFGQGTAEPKLYVSWFPAAGAQYYQAQISYDGGDESWIDVYQGNGNSFNAVVDPASLTLRVSGIGIKHGAWYAIHLDPPTIVVGPGTVDVLSLIAGLNDLVTNQFKIITDGANATAQLIASLAAEQDAANWMDKAANKGLVNSRTNELTSLIGTNIADISEIMSTLVTDEAAFATLSASVTAQFATVTSSITTNATAISTLNSAFASNVTTVSAQIGGIDSEITTTSTAVATIGGKLAASYTVLADVNGYVSGIQAYNNGAVSQFIILTDDFEVASPAHGSAGVPKPVFAIAPVNGVDSIVFSGTFYEDGMIQAGSAIIGNAAIGTLQVAGNSVTTSGEVAGNVSGMAAGTGDTLVASITKTFDVSPQFVQVITYNDVVAGAGGLTNVKVTVKRDGSSIGSKTINAPAGAVSFNVALFADSPSSGTHTYDFYLANTAAGGAASWDAPDAGIFLEALLR